MGLVQERSNRGMIQGKWKYQMIGGKDGGPMIRKTVNITAEDLKEALKNKRLTFGKKGSCAVDTMRRTVYGKTSEGFRKSTR